MKSLDIPFTGTKIDYITIRFTGGRAIGRLNRSSIHTVTVPYGSFTHKLGTIHRSGGKVISISTPYNHSVQTEVTLDEVAIAGITEPTTEAIAEVATVEQVAVAVPEVVTESVEPVTEELSVAETTEPVIIETVVDLTVESLTVEPVIESIEPITDSDSTAGSVVDSVAEPIVEPETSAKPKKSRSSSKSGGFNKPKVDAAPAKATRSPRKPKS